MESRNHSMEVSNLKRRVQHFSLHIFPAIVVFMFLLKKKTEQFAYPRLKRGCKVVFRWRQSLRVRIVLF